MAMAAVVGFGIFFLLFLNSTRILFESQLASEAVVTLPPGVRFSVQTDKRVYRSGDAVLIAVRNDSRLPIWIQNIGDPCAAHWWQVEQLGNEDNDWNVVARTKQPCPPATAIRFTNHTVKSDTWIALVPGSQPGDVMVGAPAGTYRISMPYVKGKTQTIETWPVTGVSLATSPQFTIQ